MNSMPRANPGARAGHRVHPSNFVESRKVFSVARRNEKIPVHRKARHPGEAHGLSARQQITDAGGVEGENQLIHFGDDPPASFRSTEIFHAFNSAWVENRRLLKPGSFAAAGAATTVGLATHSRYLAL